MLNPEVLAVLVILAAVALLAGFGAFAILKMKPDWLKINAESRLARFSMELGRSDKPREERRELEPGRDGLRPGLHCARLASDVSSPLVGAKRAEQSRTLRAARKKRSNAERPFCALSGLGLWRLGPRLGAAMDMRVRLCAVIFQMEPHQRGYAERAPGIRRVNHPIKRRVPERTVTDEICIIHLINRYDAAGQIASHVPPLPVPRLAYVRARTRNTTLLPVTRYLSM